MKHPIRMSSISQLTLELIRSANEMKTHIFRFAILSFCLLAASGLSAQVETELFVPCYGSSGCVVNSEIRVTSGSISPPAGPGQPGIIHGDGESIEICYTQSLHVSLGVNWHQGTQAEVGPGWEPINASSGLSGPSSGASGTGSYIYSNYSDNCPGQGECGGDPSGVANGWGWYYDSGQNVQCGGSPIDGDASNNWGDYNPFGLNQLEFCYQFVTECDANVFNEIDTQIDFRVYADSEMGTWNTCGCEGGAIECSIPFKIVCCDAPDISEQIFADVDCADLLTQLYVSGDVSNPDYVYNWQGPNGAGPQGSNQPVWSFPAGNAAPGEYTLEVTNIDDNNCVLEMSYTLFAGGDGADFSGTSVCIGSWEEVLIYPDSDASYQGTFGGPLCNLAGVNCGLDPTSGVPFVSINPSALQGQGLEGTTSNLIYSVGNSASPCFSFSAQPISFLAAPPAPSVVPTTINVCPGDNFPGIFVSPNLGWEYHWYSIPQFGVSQAVIAQGTSSLSGAWPMHIDPIKVPPLGAPYFMYVTAVNQATGCHGPWTEVEIFIDDCAVDCNGVSGGTDLPGTACNDGNVCTTNDTFDANCNCVGTLIDSDSDGVCDANDQCPGLNDALIGQPCNDFNPNTSDDVYSNDCICQGILFDCNGTPGGTALPGTPCPSAPGFINSTWDNSCMCVGTPIGSQAILLDGPFFNGNTSGFSAIGNVPWSAAPANDCDGQGATFEANGGVFVISNAEGANCCDCTGSGNPICGDNYNYLSVGPINASGYFVEITPDFVDVSANGPMEPPVSVPCANFNCGDTTTSCGDPLSLPGSSTVGQDQLIIAVNGIAVRSFCGQSEPCPNPTLCFLDEDITIEVIGGTQSPNESYEISNMTLTGFPYQISNLEACASNQNGNQTCMVNTLSACQGDDVSLNLQVDIFPNEIPPSASFQWYKDGLFIDSNTNNEDLLISNFNLSDVGTYSLYVVFSGAANSVACDLGPFSINVNESQSNCNQPATTSLTVYLEGYTLPNGNMRTSLQANNLLPLTQPFNTAPHFYPGAESVVQHANTIVDWILVELRDPTNPSLVVERKALRLRNDGAVVDSNGSTTINWNNSGMHHIVVKHRSHLGIQSAQAIDINPGAVYDFSSATSQAAGMQQQVIVSGKAAMSAGDFDQNGTVNFFDFILWLQSNNVLNTYIAPDPDGNGGINFFDFILWLKNQNKLAVSSIP